MSEPALSRFDPHDQRRYLRYEVLHFATVMSEDGAASHCVMIDVGLGGMQYRTRNPLAIGTMVRISIGRSDEVAPLVVHGEVRHCKAVEESELFAIGIRFVPEDAAERKAVASHVHDVFRRQCELMAI